MFYTKGEAQGAPECIKKLSFNREIDPATFIKQVIDEGYIHYLRTQGPYITIASLSHEWRILRGGLFFKQKFEEVDLLDSLKNISDNVPFYGMLKGYINMKGFHMGGATARFNSAEASEWVKFFELTPESWQDAHLLLAQ